MLSRLGTTYCVVFSRVGGLGEELNAGWSVICGPASICVLVILPVVKLPRLHLHMFQYLINKGDKNCTQYVS